MTIRKVGIFMKTKRIVSFILCVIITLSCLNLIVPSRTTAATVKYTDVCEHVETNGRVNIRKGAGTSNEKITTLSKEVQLLRIGVGSNGWSRVIYKGSVAFVNSSYLTKTNHDISKDKSGTYISNVTFDRVNEKMIAKSNVNIRVGPSTSFDKVGLLEKGNSVIRIGVGSNGWSQVVYNDQVRYISSKYLTKSETQVKKTVYATATINVRSGPSTSYESLGALKKNDSITSLGVEDNGWHKVNYGGKTGYINGNYLSTKKGGSVSTSSYPLTYRTSTGAITIYKEWYKNAYVYAAHIVFTDYDRFSTACANGKYNNGTETTSHAAKRLGAVFAVNGCYSAPYLKYQVVRDGKIWNGGNRNLWVPAVYNSYNGLFVSAW